MRKNVEVTSPSRHRWRGAVGVGGLLTLLACAPPDATERVGEVWQSVSNLGNEHELVQNEFEVQNVSTAWIPNSQTATNGAILTAYTVGGVENPGAWYAYTEDSGFMSSTNWQPGGPAGDIGAQFRWDDLNHPWPEPENFCDVYPGCGTTFIFGEYTASVKALSTDHLDTAAIVAVTRTDEVDPMTQQVLHEYYDVVMVTSVDGGETFTNARILSTDLAPGLGSGGHQLEWPHRVAATTIVTTEEGTERDRDSTAAHVVVWFGGTEPERWWATKVLVDPNTGRIAVLSDPLELGIFNPDTSGTSRVTVAAYEDEAGLENIAFFASERREQDETPYSKYLSLSCSDQPLIRWRYSRAVGLFDHDPSLVGPNWAIANLLIDEDARWKPCVGPGTTLYENDERGDMAFNRGPWLAKFAYAKARDGVMRVHMVERGLAGLGYIGTPSASGTTRTQILDAGEGEEDYNPKIEMGQGTDSTSATSRDNPRFGLVRKRVDGNDDISIIGRTENWFIWFGSPLNPGGYATQESVDEAVLSGPKPPSVEEGTTLGLTHQPICYSDDYGTCLNSVPERLFHAAFPRSVSDSINGIAFED